MSTVSDSIPAPYVNSFHIRSCEKISLDYTDYKKGRSTNKTRTGEITDPVIIDQVLELLKQLPDKGEMFISFVPLSALEVTLRLDDNSSRHFMYHNEMLKTPDTTFYDIRRKEEKELYQLLLSKLK